jgi:hypothetical protein
VNNHLENGQTEQPTSETGLAMSMESIYMKIRVFDKVIPPQRVAGIEVKVSF